MNIKIEELQVSFDNKEVLKKLSLVLPSKKFIGIIGPNGSGKSTMLKCIYRILQPNKGTIYIDGKPLAEYSIKETAQKSAVLSQHNYFNFDFEVVDVVLMGRTPYKNSMEADNNEDYEIARENLRIVGMSDYEESNFSLLSGGEQQRVMLARALTQQTECLILDEPTNHLDIKYQLQLMNIIKNKGLSVVAAIHDLNIAAKYCDLIVAMKDGVVTGMGTPAELLTSDFIRSMYDVEADIINCSDGRLVVAYR